MARCCCNFCSACCLTACRVDAGVENGISLSVDGVVMRLTTSLMMVGAFADWW